MAYGKELILDLYMCNPDTFTRLCIERWLVELCDSIGMVREDLHFWDYDGYPEEYKAAPDHLAGTSVVQFIKTSTVVCHTLDRVGEVFINVFSCKDFNAVIVADFTKRFFGAKEMDHTVLERGRRTKCVQPS